jgi:hypothetical protein
MLGSPKWSPIVATLSSRAKENVQKLGAGSGSKTIQVT